MVDNRDQAVSWKPKKLLGGDDFYDFNGDRECTVALYLPRYSMYVCS